MMRIEAVEYDADDRLCLNMYQPGRGAGMKSLSGFRIHYSVICLLTSALRPYPVIRPGFKFLSAGINSPVKWLEWTTAQIFI